jgi:hypothetical protein
MGAVCCCSCTRLPFLSRSPFTPGLSEPVDYNAGRSRGVQWRSPLTIAQRLPSTTSTFTARSAKVHLERLLSRFPTSPALLSHSQVRVVEHKPTKKLYALKYIDKARCIRQKAVANVIQERRLLEEVRDCLYSNVALLMISIYR